MQAIDKALARQMEIIDKTHGSRPASPVQRSTQWTVVNGEQVPSGSAIGHLEEMQASVMNSASPQVCFHMAQAHLSTKAGLSLCDKHNLNLCCFLQRILSLTQKLHAEYTATRVERERVIAEREELVLRRHTLEQLFAEQARAARAEVAALRQQYEAQVAHMHELSDVFNAARSALAAAHGKDVSELSPELIMEAMATETTSRLQEAQSDNAALEQEVQLLKDQLADTDDAASQLQQQVAKAEAAARDAAKATSSTTAASSQQLKEAQEEIKTMNDSLKAAQKQAADAVQAKEAVEEAAAVLVKEAQTAEKHLRSELAQAHDQAMESAAASDQRVTELQVEVATLKTKLAKASKGASAPGVQQLAQQSAEQATSSAMRQMALRNLGGSSKALPFSPMQAGPGRKARRTSMGVAPGASRQGLLSDTERSSLGLDATKRYGGLQRQGTPKPGDLIRMQKGSLAAAKRLSATGGAPSVGGGDALAPLREAPTRSGAKNGRRRRSIKTEFLPSAPGSKNIDRKLHVQHGASDSSPSDQSEPEEAENAYLAILKHSSGAAASSAGLGSIPTVRSQTTRLGRSRQSIAVVLQPDMVAKPASEQSLDAGGERARETAALTAAKPKKPQQHHPFASMKPIRPAPAVLLPTKASSPPKSRKSSASGSSAATAMRANRTAAAGIPENGAPDRSAGTTTSSPHKPAPSAGGTPPPRPSGGPRGSPAVPHGAAAGDAKPAPAGVKPAPSAGGTPPPRGAPSKPAPTKPSPSGAATAAAAGDAKPAPAGVKPVPSAGGTPPPRPSGGPRGSPAVPHGAAASTTSAVSGSPPSKPPKATLPAATSSSKTRRGGKKARGDSAAAARRASTVGQSP